MSTVVEGVEVRWLSPRACALYAGVTERTVRVWLRTGVLQKHWLGRRIRIDVRELDALILRGRGDHV
jgi:excisionase family DNA binding protein